jgi:hypothetical protein
MILPYPWRPEDVEALAASRDFAHIGEIMLGVVSRFEEPVTMLSGPMTTGGYGSVELNLAAYRRAIAYMRDRGHDVFDQLLGEEALKRHWVVWSQKNSDYCWQLLHDIYEPIFRAGRIHRIAFMPDWQSSRGAAWEHGMAEELGIERFYLPPDWDPSPPTAP